VRITESVDKPDLKFFSEKPCNKSDGRTFQTGQTLSENDCSLLRDLNLGWLVLDYEHE